MSDHGNEGCRYKGLRYDSKNVCVGYYDYTLCQYHADMLDEMRAYEPEFTNASLRGGGIGGRGL